jgi:predicted transcriptional regulator
MRDVDRLRVVLRAYSLKRIEAATRISRETLRRYRDGHTSPTFDAHDKIMDVVIADAISTVTRGRPRKESVSRSVAAPA